MFSAEVSLLSTRRDILQTHQIRTWLLSDFVQKVAACIVLVRLPAQLSSTKNFQIYNSRQEHEEEPGSNNKIRAEAGKYMNVKTIISSFSPFFYERNGSVHTDIADTVE